MIRSLSKLWPYLSLAFCFCYLTLDGYAQVKCTRDVCYYERASCADGVQMSKFCKFSYWSDEMGAKNRYNCLYCGTKDGDACTKPAQNEKHLTCALHETLKVWRGDGDDCSQDCDPKDTKGRAGACAKFKGVLKEEPRAICATKASGATEFTFDNPPPADTDPGKQ
jgi:hypothetical protein